MTIFSGFLSMPVPQVPSPKSPGIMHLVIIKSNNVMWYLYLDIAKVGFIVRNSESSLRILLSADNGQ